MCISSEPDGLCWSARWISSVTCSSVLDLDGFTVVSWENDDPGIVFPEMSRPGKNHPGNIIPGNVFPGKWLFGKVTIREMTVSLSMEQYWFAEISYTVNEASILKTNYIPGIVGFV